MSVALALVASLGAATAAPVVAQDFDPVTDQQKPFIWPTTGRITQQYGCTGFWAEPRYGSCRHFHGGIDIADRQGTPIFAAADGVITQVGRDPWGSGAWMVMINHGDGLTTWYAHMRAGHIDGIRVGARVQQGDVIGHMSATGMATGVHLHWAVLRNGRYVNPRKFVDGRPRKTRTSDQPSNVASCTDIWIAAVPGALTAAAMPGVDGASGGGVSCAG